MTAREPPADTAKLRSRRTAVRPNRTESPSTSRTWRNLDPLRDPVARMPDDHVALAQALHDLRVERRPVPDDDISLPRPAPFHQEHAPAIAAPEQRARRDGQHAVALPHDDADLHA